jgi:hypothetical protein
MINYLYIDNGVVVHIVEEDESNPPSKANWGGNFDTIAQDDSKTFKIGDLFTSELQLEYNKSLWLSKNWVSDTPVSKKF